MDNQKFGIEFNNYLRKNIDAFQEDCVQFVRDSTDTYKSIIVKNQMLGSKANSSVFEYIAVIKKTISDKSNFIFKPENTVPLMFKYNEIRVFVDSTDILKVPEWGTAAYDKMIIENKNQNLMSYHQFWLNINKDTFKKLASFEAFQDYLVLKENISNTQKKEQTNIDGWVNYFDNMLEYFFPTFNQKFNKGTNKTFYKNLNEQYFFGVSYNPSKYKQQLKKKGVSFPEDVNLVFGDKSVLKSPISLGIFGNPLFYHPVYPLESFKVLDEKRGFNEGKGIEYLLVEKRDENGNIMILHPPVHGNNLKSHAYFYMNSLAESTQSYLNYIESCLKDVLREK